MASSAESFGASGAAAPTQMFVINLAASTSPMALSHPSSPELKRFTFFVSRQREEGRERFRLHMGYFASQEEAENLLPSVRDVYPAAWAGPAPTTGAGRRGRIAPGSVVAAAAAPSSARPAPVIAAVPTAQVAPAGVPATAPAASPSTRDTTPASHLDTMSNVRDVLAQLSETGSRVAPADAPTVQVRMPAAASAPDSPKPAPVAKVIPAAALPPQLAANAAPVAQKPELSAFDALSLLEEPASSASTTQRVPVLPTLPPMPSAFEGLENEPEVRLVTPEDTQTLTDINLDRENNAPPCFAVQLVWSAAPINVAALPHLAIFEAYTLYNVEGNRQGRKWYGLRLGFFSDPDSATQVANYVRSDYKAVAVVPVAVKERDRAKGGVTPLAAVAAAPRKTTEKELVRDGMEGFELLADDRPPPPRRDLDDGVRRNAPVVTAAVPAAAATPRVARPVPVVATAAAGAPKAAGKPTGKRVVARRRPPPVPQGRTISAGVGGAEVLESTLEILGASTLSLDNGGRSVITDASARKAADKKSGGNRFSRLLSRLSGG